MAPQFEFMTRFPTMILYSPMCTDFTDGPNIKWNVLHALRICTGRYPSHGHRDARMRRSASMHAAAIIIAVSWITGLLPRIITARNTVVFRMSRCSSLPKYIRHVCTFLPNIFCVCFFTNHKSNGR